jgi:Co/Zn/Cd efflux system component
MAHGCCDDGVCEPGEVSGAFRKALWVALVLNGAMFAVEAASGVYARSVSLQADALDFLGDAANYGISLLVLGWGLAWRARVAWAKGLTMALFGLWVLGYTIYSAVFKHVPAFDVMGGVAIVALVVNVTCAGLLFKFRGGDANMRSVWLCSRNDAFANIAVMIAAAGVWGTGTAWPDLAVGAVIAALGLTSGIHVLRQARRELTPTAL